MNAIISVIVPVYNIEQYLHRCIDSILNQKYAHLEIILINDGSTDCSGEICDTYAKQDKRIRVIHKKNGGLSDARNVGLDSATGDYIAFIDSDDYIHGDMLSVMMEVLRNHNLPIVECNYKKSCELMDPSFYEVTNTSPEVTIFSKRDAVINTILDHKLLNVATNKLYKRNLWNDMRFPTGKIFEDVATTYKVIDQCENVGKIDNVFYYYFQRGDSIVNSSNCVNKMVHCEAIMESLQYISVKYPEAMPLCCLKFHFTAMAYLYEILLNKKQIQEADRIINDLRDMIVSPDYCSYYDQDKDSFSTLCQDILLEDYEALVPQRSRVKIKLMLLKNKTLWGFYVLNALIINSKSAIGRIKYFGDRVWKNGRVNFGNSTDI